MLSCTRCPCRGNSAQTSREEAWKATQRYVDTCVLGWRLAGQKLGSPWFALNECPSRVPTKTVFVKLEQENKIHGSGIKVILKEDEVFVPFAPCVGDNSKIAQDTREQLQKIAVGLSLFGVDPLVRPLDGKHPSSFVDPRQPHVGRVSNTALPSVTVCVRCRLLSCVFIICAG